MSDKARVTELKVDHDGHATRAVVELIREEWGVSPTIEPRLSDLPPDFRTALVKWLGATIPADDF